MKTLSGPCLVVPIIPSAALFKAISGTFQRILRLPPAECTEGGGDDCGQAQGSRLSVLPQEYADAVLDLLQLFLACCHRGSLGLQPLRLVHHPLVGLSHLVLQSKLHVGQKLAGGWGWLRGKQDFIPDERQRRISEVLTEFGWTSYSHQTL